MEQKLKYIEVEKICPHPDNPRKDVGDLTELAESIKRNGVMQNLTVVKRLGEITHEWHGLYTVVIGHRRLAAARLAGLQTVPCVVSDMDLHQQVATMLLENMQRSDLTVYEQAQGFQLMLDLGETIKSCAEKTGFSESTVRRRTKLLELDQDEFKKSCERGATLQDYIELDKIKDPALKNEVLATVGTNNFGAKLNSALGTEKARVWVKECVAVLKTFASPIKAEQNDLNNKKYRYVETFALWNKKSGLPETPEDSKSVAYYYKVAENEELVTLYKERAKTQESTDGDESAAEIESEENRRRGQLKEVNMRAYELRKQFVKGVPNSVAKQHLGDIIAFNIRLLMRSYMSINEQECSELFDIEILETETGEDYSQLYSKANQSPEKAALLETYLTYGDSERECYSDWKGDKQENEDLDELYELLEKLGYEMSDEEKQMQDGTHSLFKKK